MKTINSRHNPHIKTINALKQPKVRKKQGKFVAEGLRVCSTLVRAGWQPSQMYVTEFSLDEAKNLVSQDLITLVTNDVMQKISQATTPSGILGIFEIPKKPKTEKLTAGIVLANITDPGNMGTIIRSAAAMGLTTVVIIDGTDVWGNKVVQATAGTIAHVDIFVWSWEKLIELKKDKQLVALVVENGKQPSAIEHFDNSLLVVGNEAHGIPQPYLQQCNALMTIPMPGKTESLNASVAASIAMYLMINK